MKSEFGLWKNRTAEACLTSAVRFVLEPEECYYSDAPNSLPKTIVVLTLNTLP